MPKLATLARSLKKLPLWWNAKRDTRYFLNRALWDTGLPWTDLRPEGLNDIFPGVEDRTEPVSVVHPFARTRGISVELEEMVTMASITQLVGASNLLEIGTFDGNSAINFAMNMGDDGKVITIDLPPGDVAPESGEEGSARNPTSFTKPRYVGHPLNDRVRQVYGDSATLEWDELPGPFDAIFIDGDHSSSYVTSDTLNALKVLAPGGLLLWHDYNMASVATVLNRFAAHGAPIRWISGTRLATAVVAEPTKLRQQLAKLAA